MKKTMNCATHLGWLVPKHNSEMNGSAPEDLVLPVGTDTPPKPKFI